jgi:hypothetical protein
VIQAESAQWHADIDRLGYFKGAAALSTLGVCTNEQRGFTLQQPWHPHVQHTVDDDIRYGGELRERSKPETRRIAEAQLLFDEHHKFGWMNEMFALPARPVAQLLQPRPQLLRPRLQQHLTIRPEERGDARITVGRVLLTSVFYVRQ